MTAISVCFASRGRPESLRKAAASLLGHATRPADIEIWVALDPDEPQRGETVAALQDAGMLEPPVPKVKLWTAPERFGYTRLHDYLNPLAKQAQGEWVMWFNDDMRMLTSRWDIIVRQQRPAILWPRANHVAHANICPAWPRAWSDAMGHVTPTSHMDTYLQWLGEALGRHDRIPVEILHDRADVTGAHDDQTYAEGRKLLGPEGMVPGFDAAAVRAQLATDAAVIRRLIAPGWGGLR